LPAPDRATITRFAGAIEASELELKRLAQVIAALDDAIAATQLELARLSQSGAVPTKAVLVQARQIRDARLDALRADVDGARDARAAGLDGVAEASRAIDGITDQLLTDTERATRQEDAQRHLADARDAREREAAKRAGVQRALDETGESRLSGPGLLSSA
jgi:hypothetical protein